MGSPALAVIDAVAARQPASSRRGANLSVAERAGSAIAGAVLLLSGLRRRSLGGVATAVVGGALLDRGVRGRSRLYELVGISTADARGSVERAVTVNRSPDEVYTFCHDWTSAARFLPDVLSVKADRGGRLTWIGVTGDAGTSTWQASIVADTPGEIIAWRGIGGPWGSLTFRSAPGDRGTEVRLSLEQASAADVAEALRCLQQLVAAGERPPTAGQPAGCPERGPSR